MVRSYTLVLLGVAWVYAIAEPTEVSLLDVCVTIFNVLMPTCSVAVVSLSRLGGAISDVILVCVCVHESTLTILWIWADV